MHFRFLFQNIKRRLVYKSKFCRTIIIPVKNFLTTKFTEDRRVYPSSRGGLQDRHGDPENHWIASPLQGSQWRSGKNGGKREKSQIPPPATPCVTRGLWLLLHQTPHSMRGYGLFVSYILFQFFFIFSHDFLEKRGFGFGIIPTKCKKWARTMKKLHW